MKRNGTTARFLALAVASITWFAPAALAETVSARVGFSRVIDLDVGVDGTVAGVAVGEGEAVLPGTLLLRLETKPFQAALDSANAALELAKEELAEAMRSYDRDQVLYDDGSLSTVELDQSRIALLKHKAATTAAARDVAEARLNLGMSKIVVSEPGVVTEVNVSTGAHLNQRSGRGPAIRFGLYPLVARTNLEKISVDQLSIGDELSAIQNNASIAVKVVRILAPDQHGRFTVVFEGDINGPAGTPVQIEIPRVIKTFSN